MYLIIPYIFQILFLVLTVPCSPLPQQLHHFHVLRRRTHPSTKPPLLKRDHHTEKQQQHHISLQEELSLLDGLSDHPVNGGGGDLGHNKHSGSSFDGKQTHHSNKHSSDERKHNKKKHEKKHKTRPSTYEDNFPLLEEKVPEDIEENSEKLKDELSHHGIMRVIVDEEDGKGHTHIKQVILESEEENEEPNTTLKPVSAACRFPIICQGELKHMRP